MSARTFHFRGLITAAATLVAVVAARAGTVTLLPAATLEAPRTVTLADIADLTGDDARRAAGAAVISEAELSKRLGRGGAVTLTIGDVRAALARAGTSTSRLALSGGSCDVRVLSASVKPQSPVRTSVQTAPEMQVVGTLLNDAGTPAIKRAAAESVVTFLDSQPQRVRVMFEPRDAAFLSSATGSQSVLARPLNDNPESGSVVVEVRVLEGGVQKSVTSLTVKAEVLATVLRASRDIPRKAVLAHADLEQTEHWVSPGVLRSASDLPAAQIVGQTARHRITAGSVLTRDLMSPAIAVKRNEFFDVWVYQGNLAVKARATALKDGAVGETIPARLDRQRATFQVRLEGERRGVVLNDAAAGG